jgi:calcineurin-like phosphoesterase family protein
MKVFFTSDTHFGHNNIRRFCPVTRGHYLDVDHMDDDMIRNWNDMVGADDVVYHLGDFAFASQGRITEVLLQLNGRIRLLVGNHDKALSKGFGERLVDMQLLEMIYQGYHEANFNGQHIVMNHFAQRVWNRHHHGTIHVYGHSHGSLPGLGKSVDVGVDSAELGLYTGDNMRPYSLEEIVTYLSTKVVYNPDYHNEDTNR